jgi:hypothetical protein
MILTSLLVGDIVQYNFRDAGSGNDEKQYEYEHFWRYGAKKVMVGMVKKISVKKFSNQR